MSDSAVQEPAQRAASSSTDAGDDGLVEQSRARVARALGDREFLPTMAMALAFVAVAAALLAWLPVGRPDAGLGVTLALVVCYAAAARVQFEVAFAYAVPTQLVFVPMLFLAPLELVPLLVALGIFLSKLPEHLRGEWHLGRVGIHLISSWHSVGPVLVLAAAGSPTPELRHLPLVAVAVLAQFALDFASSASRAFALGIGLRALVRALGPAWLVDLALTPLGVGLAYASLTQSYAFLLGLPLMGLLAYFARERKARINHALELSHAYRGTALLLGDVVEADDEYTGLHSQDVVSLVLGVGERLGLDANARREAEFTALLHDVGKVKMPKEIINKPGALTPEERAIINTHTIEGELMLEKIGGLLGDVGHLVRSCHERWDGAGYPDGLAGEEIPLVARIVCACDAFSAMTTDRPYRQALSHEDALEELRRCAGTQFDRRVVEALVAVADSAEPRPVLLAPAA
ncbi:MAG: HD-GYP domain-containing protein [Actinomycetota bacterium]|nr:HD-GYP domain-containing protein [Actinomycetota bacterium]